MRHQNPSVLVVHCMIHREALAFKSLPNDILSVLNQSIKVVNFIKSQPLHSQFFSQLHEVMDLDYNCLLYPGHTEPFSIGIEALFPIYHKLWLWMGDQSIWKEWIHESNNRRKWATHWYKKNNRLLQSRSSLCLMSTMSLMWATFSVRDSVCAPSDILVTFWCRHIV